MAVGVVARLVAEIRINESVGREATEAIGRVTSSAGLPKSRAGKAGIVHKIQSIIRTWSAKSASAVAAFAGRVACTWRVDV